MIPDYQPIPWDESLVAARFERSPGLYDDVYMDLTFLEVMAREGIDAPASSHAQAFARAGYPLWHANQAARYNVLNGLLPPDSGHWTNSPHADDIDFQIEADFAGLMSPGLVNAGAEDLRPGRPYHELRRRLVRRRVRGGHVQPGFRQRRLRYVVEEALKVLPPESNFAQCVRDVVACHRADPSDWKKAWFEVERKWAEDVGCPDFVFDPGNIDARVNGAYIVIGLLYGEGTSAGRSRSRPGAARTPTAIRPAPAASSGPCSDTGGSLRSGATRSGPSRIGLSRTRQCRSRRSTRPASSRPSRWSAETAGPSTARSSACPSGPSGRSRSR